MIHLSKIDVDNISVENIDFYKLCGQVRENGVKELYDNFEVDRVEVGVKL